MTKRDAQKAEHREHILEVAKRCFRVDGYEATTLRGIAKAAEMSTGAIFGNWSDKDALYREIYGRGPVTPEQGLVLLEAAKEVVESNGRMDAVALLAAVVANVEGWL